MSFGIVRSGVVIHIRASGVSTDDDWAQYHVALGGMLAEARRMQTKVGLLVDARAATPPTHAQRRSAAAWLEARLDDLRHGCFGVAIAITGVLPRAGLNVVLWIRPLPVGHLVCETTDEAMRWLESRDGTSRAVA